MVNKVLQLARHPLILGSGIVFTGSFIANILAYLFNLSMGRLLTVSDYGLLTSLVSMLALVAVIQLSLSGIIAKFTAKYRANNDELGISNLITHGLRFVIVIALIIFILFTIFTPLIQSLLKVGDVRLLFFVYASIATSIIAAFSMGMLQGEMKFIATSILNILYGLIKIAFGIVSIYLGFGLLGISGGLLLAALIPFVISIIYIRKLHPQRKSKVEDPIKDSSIFITEFRKYSSYFFLSALAMSIISNGDIMLVRTFYSPEISGQYAALSLMGKVIFYLTSPIYFVLFPLIAQKREKNEKIHNTILFTVSLVSSISVIMSIIYFMFPNLILSIFFPSADYKILTEYLGPFSLYIVIFSIATIFNNYFLSIGRTEIYKFNLITAFLYILTVTFFHDTLYQMIGILFGVSLLLLSGYLLYYFRLNYGKN